MRQPEPVRMTEDGFLEWNPRRDERWESVDRIPVRMMAGTREGHTVVTANIVMTIGPQTKKRGCSTMSSGMAVGTRPGGIHYPDMVVNRAPPDRQALTARNPVVVIEVASDRTRRIDLIDRPNAYRNLDTIRVVMLIEPASVAVRVHRRDQAGVLALERYAERDAVIDLPEVGAALPVAEVYDTHDPEPRPLLREVG